MNNLINGNRLPQSSITKKHLPANRRQNSFQPSRVVAQVEPPTMIQPVAAPTPERGRAAVEKNLINRPSTPADQPCTSGNIVAVANQQPKHVGREPHPGSQQHQALARRQPSHRPFFMTCNNQQDPEADQQPSSNLQLKTTTTEGSQLATCPRELEASNNKPSKQIISPGSRNRKQQTNKAI